MLAVAIFTLTTSPNGSGGAGPLAVLAAVAGSLKSPLLDWPDPILLSLGLLASGLVLIAAGVRGLRRGPARA
jgi:hypothetical protein